MGQTECFDVLKTVATPTTALTHRLTYKPRTTESSAGDSTQSVRALLLTLVSSSPYLASDFTHDDNTMEMLNASPIQP